MLKDPIICPPQVDTFLVPAQNVLNIQKARIPVVQKKALANELEACLDEDLNMPEGYWEDDNTTLEQQKDSLLAQREILEESKSKGR